MRHVPFAISIGIIVLSVVCGISWTVGKTKKRKYIIWSLLAIFGIGPFAAWLIGMMYAFNVGDGFAGMGVMILLYGATFIIAFLFLIAGLFMKSSLKTIAK